MDTLTQAQLESSFIDWPIHMQRALDLAASVLSATPNPRVGCVLIRDGQVLAEGWHEAAGKAHAEVHALSRAESDVRGATAFVSLEPCNHQGRTGPCAQALIEAGVSRVVIATLDPNPNVAGQGVNALEAAGVVVCHLADFEDAARQLNRGYFKRREQGLPFVTVKLAMSLDGRTALANGVSQWITGAEARQDVQRLRAASSVVLTGINTLLDDDPALTVRSEQLALSARDSELNADSLAQPRLRAVLDSQLRTPGTARIFTSPGEVLVYASEAACAKAGSLAGATLVPAAMAQGRLNLQSVLESLAAEHECNEVLVEAGATLSSAFVRAGLVDELVVYIAPKILGSDARPLLDIQGLTDLDAAPRFVMKHQENIGSDIKLTLAPAR